MLELQCIAVLPGVAIGKVLIPSQEGFGITRSQIHSSDRHQENPNRPAQIAGQWVRLDYATESTLQASRHFSGKLARSITLFTAKLEVLRRFIASSANLKTSPSASRPTIAAGACP